MAKNGKLIFNDEINSIIFALLERLILITKVMNAIDEMTPKGIPKMVNKLPKIVISYNDS